MSYQRDLSSLIQKKKAESNNPVSIVQFSTDQWLLFLQLILKHVKMLQLNNRIIFNNQKLCSEQEYFKEMHQGTLSKSTKKIPELTSLNCCQCFSSPLSRCMVQSYFLRKINAILFFYTLGYQVDQTKQMLIYSSFSNGFWYLFFSIFLDPFIFSLIPLYSFYYSFIFLIFFHFKNKCYLARIME